MSMIKLKSAQLAILLYFLAVIGPAYGIETPQQRLRNHLLQNYDKSVTPIEHHDQPMHVQLGLVVLHIDLDEVTSIMSLDAWVRLKWADEHLTWDPNQYENIQKLHLSPEEIWLPDIVLYNNADEGSIAHFSGTYAIVEHDGSIFWVPPAFFKSFCEMNMKSWPYDTHLCSFTFGSWTKHGNEINLTMFHTNVEIEPSHFAENPQWDIVGDISAVHSSKIYDCCPEAYIDVTYTFQVRRNSPALATVVNVPIVVISTMVTFSFLLGPKSETKVLINAMAAVITVLVLASLGHLVNFSKHTMPTVVSVYGTIAVMVGLALFLNIVTLHLASSQWSTPPPVCLTSFFTASLVNKVLCIGKYRDQMANASKRIEVSQSPIEDEAKGAKMCEILSHDWLLVLAGAEKMFFFLFSAIFAVLALAEF